MIRSHLPFIVLLFASLLLFQACSKKQQVNLNSSPVELSYSDIQKIDTNKIVNLAPISPVEELVDAKGLSEELNFTYLKAKSKVSWKTDKDQDHYTVDIRVKKDSIIWMNISVAMISGASGIFTKDRVQFYDKIGDKYFSFSYDSLSTTLGFKIDYQILQSLIVGNEPFKRKNSKVIRENENFIIQQQEGQVKIDNFVGPNRKLKKLLLKDEPTENQFSMNFEEFATINQVLFPYSSEITLDVKNDQNVLKKTIISIKYSKVELLDAALTFPFKVPEKYLRKK